MLPPYRSYVLVSRQQIAQNYRDVRTVVGPDVEVMCVVKADAYGHGALEVARVLVSEGARWLAVSSVDEGVQLRSSGLHEIHILVMGGFLPYEGEALVEYNLTPAIHSLAQWQGACAEKKGGTIRVTMGPAPWAYAAQIPLSLSEPLDGQCWYWARLQVHVLQGQVGIGFLVGDDLLGEKLLPAARKSGDIFVKLWRSNASALMIRNGSLGRPSVVELSGASVESCPKQSQSLQLLKLPGARLVEQVSSLAGVSNSAKDDSCDVTSDAKVQALQVEMGRLKELLKASEDERTKLSEEKARLTAIWHTVEGSAGWRVLNSWRRTREKLVPPGSYRRKLYDRLVRPLRGNA